MISCIVKKVVIMCTHIHTYIHMHILTSTNMHGDVCSISLQLLDNYLLINYHAFTCRP